MTKSNKPLPESAEEVLPENPGIETGNKNYIKKLELQRLVLEKLMDRKLTTNTTGNCIDVQYPDAPESQTSK